MLELLVPGEAGGGGQGEVGGPLTLGAEAEDFLARLGRSSELETV